MALTEAGMVATKGVFPPTVRMITRLTTSADGSECQWGVGIAGMLLAPSCLQAVQTLIIAAVAVACPAHHK